MVQRSGWACRTHPILCVGVQHSKACRVVGVTKCSTYSFFSGPNRSVNILIAENVSRDQREGFHTKISHDYLLATSCPSFCVWHILRAWITTCFVVKTARLFVHSMFVHSRNLRTDVSPFVLLLVRRSMPHLPCQR